MTQRAADSRFAKNFGGPIDGKAFAHSPQIEHHAVSNKPDGAGCFLELNKVHPDPRARLCQTGFVRQLPISVHETPASDQRSNGDIEGAFRFSRKPLSLL